MSNLYFIIPELFISLSVMALLVLGVFKNNSSKIIFYLSCLIILVSLAINLNINITQTIFLFNNSYLVDQLSLFIKSIIMISAFFVMFCSYNYVRVNNILKIEYPILILCSLLGMLVMISSNDLIVFYIGLELQSLALYVLASFNRDNILSSESGLKYFVLSALSSGLLLYGCSLIYGFSNSTNFNEISQNFNFEYGVIFGMVFVIVGLAFKISAVPFHMWAPDVYQGSPTSVTVLFAILPKIAALTVFIKFLYGPFINLFEEWQAIIIFLSVASMILGAVAAIGQKNLKRLIAYSSISHMGYALAGLTTGTNQGIQSSIIYLIIYLIMNLAFFSCLFMLKRKDKFYENIEDLSGLSKKHPILALSFLIILFSLAGIPPLAGFFAKFYIFMAVIQKEMYFLAIVGLLATVIAAFYYLRVIKIIYFDPEQEKFDTAMSLGLKLTLILSTSAILMYFLNPNFLNKYITNILVI
ncbi:NADH-quinone oxidoreductase subunit NuoN [Candidatus Pelagibacter communis]|uniref:NADH-quinone oxidoreductase subunit NuoN n=1 Tax=Pelagibacter ubique TaxID=198252 RepID=UPI00094D341C|nr:NADH-quinone oxidoreductase subunit NuoN [Candidatus Pelagibacter ubique]